MILVRLAIGLFALTLFGLALSLSAAQSGQKDVSTVALTVR